MRGAKCMEVEAMTGTTHEVRVVTMDTDELVLEVDGREIRAAWETLSARLGSAPQLARETIEISPADYGLHWPLVDEDLSVNGFLRDFG